MQSLAVSDQLVAVVMATLSLDYPSSTSNSDEACQHNSWISQSGARSWMRENLFWITTCYRPFQWGKGIPGGIHQLKPVWGVTHSRDRNALLTTCYAGIENFIVRSSVSGEWPPSDNVLVMVKSRATTLKVSFSKFSTCNVFIRQETLNESFLWQTVSKCL